MGGKLTTALLVGLGLATLAGCNKKPTQYATPDYHIYPARQDSVALRNIEKIFSSECWEIKFLEGFVPKYKVDSQRLQCKQKFCSRMQFFPPNQGPAHSRWGGYQCVAEEYRQIDVSWNEVIPPRVTQFQYPKTGYCVMFTNNKEKCDFKARNKRQAEDLAEAIRIYLPKRNKTHTPSTSPPAATVPSTKKEPTTTPGCQHDLQCKGERVCVQGDCVNP